jgi:hypothetical protein
MTCTSRALGDYGGNAMVKFIEFHGVDVKNPKIESARWNLRGANRRVVELNKVSIGEKFYGFFQTIFKSLGMTIWAESCEMTVNRISNDRLFKLGPVQQDIEAFEAIIAASEAEVKSDEAIIPASDRGQI